MESNTPWNLYDFASQTPGSDFLRSCSASTPSNKCQRQNSGSSKESPSQTPPAPQPSRSFSSFSFQNHANDSYEANSSSKNITGNEATFNIPVEAFDFGVREDRGSLGPRKSPVNRFKLRRTVNRARPPRHRHLAAKTSPSIHGDSHSLGVWERGFTLLAGAIHTFRGSIHDLVHTFWQGTGSFGEVCQDFAIPTQHFAKPFSSSHHASSVSC